MFVFIEQFKERIERHVSSKVLVMIGKQDAEIRKKRWKHTTHIGPGVHISLLVSYISLQINDASVDRMLLSLLTGTPEPSSS